MYNAHCLVRQEKVTGMLDSINGKKRQYLTTRWRDRLEENAKDTDYTK